MYTANVIGQKIVEVCQIATQTPEGKVYELKYIQLDNGVRIFPSIQGGAVRTEAVQQPPVEWRPLSWRHLPDGD